MNAPSSRQSSRIRQGFDLLNAGQASLAEAQFRAVLAAEPEAPEALCGLGAALRRSGQMEEAREWLQRAAAAAPDNPMPWTELGLLCVQSGDLSLAAVSLGRAAAAAPQDPGLARLIAEVRRRLNSQTGAAATPNAAVQSVAPLPSSPPPLPGPLPDFSRDAAILAYPGLLLSHEDGFHQEEASPNGPVRWLSARALIRVVRTSPAPLQGLALSFVLYAPRPANYPGAEFSAQVSVNGAPLPAAKVAANGCVSVELPLDGSEEAEWTIAITCDDEFVPWSLDRASQDNRRLSLLLHGLRVWCAKWPEQDVSCELCGQPSPHPSEACPHCLAGAPARAAAWALGLALRLDGPVSRWPRDSRLHLLDIWPLDCLRRVLSVAFDYTAAATPGNGLREGPLPLRHATGSLDAALSSEAAEFVDDDPSLFGELWRVLKPEGVLVVSSRFQPCDATFIEAARSPASRESVAQRRAYCGPSLAERLRRLGFAASWVQRVDVNGQPLGAGAVVCLKRRPALCPPAVGEVPASFHKSRRVRNPQKPLSSVSVLVCSHLFSPSNWRFQKLQTESVYKHTQIDFEYWLALDIERPERNQTLAPEFREWLESFAASHDNFHFYTGPEGYPGRLSRAAAEARCEHTLALDSDCFLIRDRWHDTIPCADVFGFERRAITPEERFWAAPRYPFDSAFFGYRTSLRRPYVPFEGGHRDLRDRVIEYVGAFFRNDPEARDTVFLPHADLLRRLFHPWQKVMIEIFHLSTSAMIRDGCEAHSIDPALGLILDVNALPPDSRMDLSRGYWPRATITDWLGVYPPGRDPEPDPRSEWQRRAFAIHLAPKRRYRAMVKEGTGPCPQAPPLDFEKLTAIIEPFVHGA